MSLPTIEASNPVPVEVAAALLVASGRFVEFNYVPLFPPRKKTPSVVAKEADEVRKGPPDVAKGFIPPIKDKDGRELPREQWPVRQTKDGNWTILLHTMNRVKALESPEGVYSQYGYEEGMYLPRCYRMEGIRLDTLVVNDGARGKVRLFPNAPATQATTRPPEVAAPI